MKTFTAQMQAATKAIEGKMLRVASEAIQDVLEAAQTPQAPASRTGEAFQVGKIPVDTAFLINSLTSNGIAGALSYTTALAGLKIGDIVRFAWTAPYALRIEHGFTGTDSRGRTYNQAGRFFVGHNAARFSEFVAKREKEIMG
jgi:hypothetical protein